MKLIWNAPKKETTAPKTFEEVLLPDGVYDLKITKADFEPDAYRKNEFNKDGMSLRLWLDTTTGQRKRIFASIGIDRPWEINAVLIACGLNAVADGGNVNENYLLDVIIKAKVVQYKSKVGKVSNVIKEYLPAHAPTGSSIRVDPVPVESDEIPF